MENLRASVIVEHQSFAHIPTLRAHRGEHACATHWQDRDKDNNIWMAWQTADTIWYASETAVAAGRPRIAADDVVDGWRNSRTPLIRSAGGVWIHNIVPPCSASCFLFRRPVSKPLHSIHHH